MTLGSLVLGSALLLLAAGLVTSCLRLRGAIDFLLGFYLVAFTLVVVIELLLSPGHDLTQTWLLAVLAGVTVGAAALWVALGRPSPPPFRPALAACREAVRDPLVLVLAVAVLGAFGVRRGADRRHGAERLRRRSGTTWPARRSGSNSTRSPTSRAPTTPA